jgi:hypothetical protein
MATVAARHLDLIAVAWGKATTFVVGGRENKCAMGRSKNQRSAQALGNNLSRVDFLEKPLRRLSKVDACVEHLVKAGMIRR